MVVIIERKKEKQKRKDYSKENKKKKYLQKKSYFLCLLFVTIFLFSGCFDQYFSSKTTYEETPTLISYDLSFGYYVNLTGKGEATINYKEYVPQSHNATITNLIVQPDRYVSEIIQNNQVITWNQTIIDTSNESFFIHAHIKKNPIIISDLTGKNSLTLKEINDLYPTIVKKYCHTIGNESYTFIDPSNPILFQHAQNLKNTVDESNAYLVGKQIFSWLKNHTTYEKHSSYQPQPAIITYESCIGDCDDLTYLYLSLCRAIGLPCRYIKGYLITNTVAVPHVWAEIFTGKQMSTTGWIPVECAGTGQLSSEIHNNFGVEDVHHIRLCVDDGTNETFQQLTNPLKMRYAQSLNINISRFESIKNYNILSSGQLTIQNNKRKYQ